MHIKLDENLRKSIISRLCEYEDAEAISTTEYIVDFYEIEKPMTVDCVFDSTGIEIIACAELLFDKEMDGWYMGERIFDMQKAADLLIGLTQ